MEYLLQNKALTVRIASRGGEILSICNGDGTEYIWQADAAYWGSHAPHLFPYVGRLTGGCYKMDGTQHEMEIHGFFRRMEMAMLQHTETSVLLLLESNEETRRFYPRDWKVHLLYELQETTLSICFMVQNQSENALHFGYGGHPGFCVPLVQGLAFEDYYLDFGNPCAPNAVHTSPACFIDESCSPMPLENGCLPLRHQLFDNDAIILRDSPTEVTLRSNKDRHFVTVKYPQMSFLGIWQKPNSDAPYVCIEPWVSLPSRQDIVETFEEKADLVHLRPGGIYKNSWSITVG